jgi:hypothetical protein
MRKLDFVGAADWSQNVAQEPQLAERAGWGRLREASDANANKSENKT